MRRAIALLFLLSAAACGGTSTAEITSPTPSGQQFRLDGIHTSATGKVVVTSSGSSTTLEVVVTGLAALSAHAASLVSGMCQQPGAVVASLDQVVADANGSADIRTTLSAKFPPASGSWLVAVRAGPDLQGANATFLLCGNLSATTSSPSPSPTPALQFPLNGIKTNASGKILVTANGGTTTIELVINGLNTDSSHVSHVHSGSCQQQGQIIFALNQVVADGTGAADTRTTIQAHYPPANGHWYVVVHAGPDMQGSNAVYLLCGNLF